MPVDVNSDDCRTIKSTITPHKATRLDGGRGWVVTWLPGRQVTQRQAVAAMQLSELVVPNTTDLKDPLCTKWVAIDRLAAELGMTGAIAAEEITMTDFERARRHPQPVKIKFVVTTIDKGDRTTVNISAHDGDSILAPFNVGSHTVMVPGDRHRADASQYFAEIIGALHAELAADAEVTR